MGNKLCKKKVDSIDGGGNNPKSQQPTPFDRIINRLHLKPKWKSDPHLEQKQSKRSDTIPLNGEVPQRPPRPLSNSKSSDWTEVSLEVPDEELQLKDSKLAFVFNEDEAPKPPPRKNKKGIREKIEAVAKSGLQALQTKKPVEEPLCVKKTIIYGCPGCDDPKHNHHPKHASTPKSFQKQNNKESKRRKNLSIVSLPNYSELKFSLVNNGETIEKLSDSEIRKSVHSLPGETKKLSTFSDKRDYITRCRSFGSSLPQLLLHKLSNAKAPLAEIESDDSFGGLEDWDLKIIEHYNPKDSSLPRKTKPVRSEQEVLNDIESLIVAEEDIDPPKPPKPPVRRSESLVKKINKTASETAQQRSNEIEMTSTEKDTPLSLTPPPSPEKIIDNPLPPISLTNLPTKDEEGKVEHSSLMRILQEFSTKKAQESNGIEAKAVSDNVEIMTPRCTPILNSVNDFLVAERSSTARENQFNNFANTTLPNVDAITT